MPLPTSSVDEIFGRMQVRYAAKFERNWAGMNLAAVKADWAEVLDGLAVRAIQFGLVNLPIEWPPNASEFRAICCQAPHSKPKQDLLPAPKPDPARLAAELIRLHELLQARAPRQWAYDLQEREAAGEILSPSQRDAWREALRTVDVTPVPAFFRRPIPEELPPAMRPDGTDPADCQKLEVWARETLFAKRERMAA